MNGTQIKGCYTQNCKRKMRYAICRHQFPSTPTAADFPETVNTRKINWISTKNHTALQRSYARDSRGTSNAN